jgi:iron complex outermembrane receptor protein
VTRQWLERGGTLVLAAALGIGAGIQAHADPQPDQDLMSMQIEDLARVQVYSASRHLEDARKAPSSVSIITAEEIRKYGWRTLGDALRTLRGFYTSYDRQYTYLGVRGFMRPGDYNSRVLLLVNGHRLNENVYGSAPIGAEFPLDLDLVDHIEVVRGPGSSLFGTNAVFAVINVITREPAMEKGAEVSGDTGSSLNRTGRATVTGSMGWSQSISSAVRGHRRCSSRNLPVRRPTTDTRRTWTAATSNRHSRICVMGTFVCWASFRTG